MTLDLNDPEILDWISEAYEELRAEVRSSVISPEEALEKLKKRRTWRTQGQEAIEVLEESYRRFKASIEGAAYKKTKGNHLTSSKANREWFETPDLDKGVFWPPVREDISSNLGYEAIESIDEESNKIMAYGGPPYKPGIRARGLVVGHVQSGKTTNFISVAAKAADEGYRLIVVLSGMTESLRQQTQERLLDSLVSHTRSRWHLLTTMEEDFQETKNQAKLGNPNERMLAVVKKNVHRLRRLNDWLDSAEDYLHGCPIMIIDDEADQASVNVANDKNDQRKRSSINAEISRLVARNRTSYIAYTATPFANVLIDPNDEDDLYPRDFIVSLPTPKGYFGPEQIFGRGEIPGEDSGQAVKPLVDALRSIPEEDLSSIRPMGLAIDEWTPSFSTSLRQATIWFLLATSVRWLRGQRGKHSTMLIHSSWLTQAHVEIESAVAEGLKDIERDHESHALLDEAKQLWYDEQKRGCIYQFEFEEVYAQIGQIIQECALHVDNGESETRINYGAASGQTVIAIGGNTLARGITLEGLVVSYFARTSRTYDTLLQMGRWFGYRPGYEDLVRIYMPEKLSEWYAELSTVEADFRQDISRFDRLEMSPLEARARIRSSDVMEVTSRIKMKNSQTAVMNYSGKRVQTLLFYERDRSWLQGNFAAARNLFAKLTSLTIEQGSRNGTKIFYEVPNEVILDFLKEYSFAEGKADSGSKKKLVTEYIKREAKSESITSWNISFFGQRRSPTPDGRGIPLGLDTVINPVTRRKLKSSVTGRARLQGLVGPTDRVNDLRISNRERSSLIAEYKESGSAEDVLRKAHDKYEGTDVGHLAVYFIDKDSGRSDTQEDGSMVKREKTEEPDTKYAKIELAAKEHIVGLALFFPLSDREDGVKYIAGRQYEDLDQDELSEILQTDRELSELAEKEGDVDTD